MELEEFYNELKQIMGERELMPFVCSGNPLEKDVIIIGFNPTTSYDFWQYFSVDKGFDAEAEFENYKKIRKENNKSELSATRRRIQKLEEMVGAERILKMNLYAKATKKEKDLAKEDRDLSLFKFLLKNLKPKVIVMHGSKAKKAVLKLDLGEIDFQGLKNVPIIYTQHFGSRGYSYQTVEELGKQVLEQID